MPHLLNHLLPGLGSLFLVVTVIVSFNGIEATSSSSCFKVVDFVADCGATTLNEDNSAQWATCVNLANSLGLPLYVPPGRFNFNQTISSAGIKVKGAGEVASILYWSVDATEAHTPAWIVSSIIPGDTWVRDLGLSSVCGRQALGINGCNRDGIWLNSAVELNSVQVQGFHSGLVWNSSTGQTVSFGCHFTNNYYGLYMANSGGHNKFMAGSLAGNTMASIGISANGYMGPGDLIWGTSMCLGPYGIYQEGSVFATTPKAFMNDVTFYMTYFEACGNGVIYSDNADLGGGVVDSVELLNVNADWGPIYQISGRPRNYAVYVGGVNQQFIYHSLQAGSSLPAGEQGIWYLGSHYGDIGGLVQPVYLPINITV